MAKISELKLPHSSDFDFSSFLAKPVDVRDWRIQVRACKPMILSRVAVQAFPLLSYKIQYT